MGNPEDSQQYCYSPSPSLADKLTSAVTDIVLMDGRTSIYLPYLVKSSAVNFDFN